MQVFYVNIGGGEPTVRRDFWELVDYAAAHHVGREVLDQRRPDHPRGRRAGSRAPTTSTCRSRSTARPRRSTTRVRGAGSFATAIRAMEHLADAGFAGLQALGRVHPAEHRPARRVQGARRPLRRAAAAHAAAPVGPRRRRLGRAAPDRGTAARAVRVAARPRRERADRRLVLPPRRLRRGAAGAEPVRRGSGGVPDRPVGDVYACPFAIHDEFLAGNVRDPGGFAARLARVGRCSTSCASRSRAAPARSCGAFDTCRGGCMAAKFFTGLPLDGPDPECVLGHGERAARRRAATHRSPRPSVDHSKRPAATRAGPSRRPEPPATRARSRACVAVTLMAGTRGSRSVAEAQRRAEKRLPKSVYTALVAGSEAGRHARGQPRRVRRARLRAARRRAAGRSATWPRP